ncbi:polymer-forming cytoskeletal protein [Burkholderia sp. Ac-20365]|uniref:polymer-forming cytoskeletal protein n=1 Tax=Burkholderia sp. Ac-20365 TaxID=2703897 RepID=UPI00197C93D4|nr:polymer-forming cytoskeletal protein [Burkholderia sp. Ac-20365]MBN3760953.1 polymer-forming cytoskeletal protein [Burkholderia sp. Ac-20365]
MNSPLAAANVAHLRREEEPATSASAQEQTQYNFDRDSAHRTSARLLPQIFQSMFERFKKTDGGQLYIDHEEENVRSALVGISEFEGTMTFNHGLHICENFSAPKGTIKAPGQTVIIAEGAVVYARIECKKLYNLGQFEGDAKVSDLVLNYGSMAGDISYGSLESAGAIRGKITPFTA